VYRKQAKKYHFSGERDAFSILSIDQGEQCRYGNCLRHWSM